MKLYKYYPLSPYSKRVLTHQEIYFSPFIALNDPFEIAVNYNFDCDYSEKEAYFVNSIDVFKQFPPEGQKSYVHKFESNYSNNTQLLQLLRDSFRKTGVFCLTKDPLNILMWGHYARNHRGFCVEFETDNDPILQSVFKIKYEEDFQGICYYSPHSIKDVLKVKFKDWAYENEWRTVEENFGIKKISPDAITKIFIGALNHFVPTDKDEYGDQDSYFNVIDVAHTHLPNVNFQRLLISRSEYKLIKP